MRLLLDSHVVIWWLSGMPVAAEAEAAIRSSDNQAFVSVASIWELRIKQAKGRLMLPESFDRIVGGPTLPAIDIKKGHADRVAGLPPIHGDPFDRMLVAQCQIEGLTLVSRDRRLAEYGVALIAA